MERLITVKDIKERYSCTGKTAAKYIRQFPLFYENPLTAPKWAMDEWEASRAVTPNAKPKRRVELLKRSTERIIVPRKRG